MGARRSRGQQRGLPDEPLDPRPRDRARPGKRGAIARFPRWLGAEVPEDAADGPGHDFDAQCAAILAAGPAVVSSIMGVYPEAMVAEMKARGIKWLATVTTVTEARQAAEAGADALVAQGFEAGGHRGAFVASEAGTTPVGLFSLLPAVVDAVDLPVVATGGIADARGVAAAFMLGASAVQIGTALLRTPEAGIPTAWAEALGRARPEDAVTTRAFTGRLGRALRSAYTDAAEATEPAQFPVQGALTTPMRAEAIAADDVTRMSAWAGQSAGLAAADPATEVVTRLWAEAKSRLA